MLSASYSFQAGRLWGRQSIALNWLIAGLTTSQVGTFSCEDKCCGPDFQQTQIWGIMNKVLNRRLHTASTCICRDVTPMPQQAWQVYLRVYKSAVAMRRAILAARSPLFRHRLRRQWQQLQVWRALERMIQLSVHMLHACMHFHWLQCAQLLCPWPPADCLQPSAINHCKGISASY